MLNFEQYIETAKFNIKVDLGKYPDFLKDKLHELAESNQQQYLDKLKTFRLDKAELEKSLLYLQYPDTVQFIAALSTADTSKVSTALRLFYAWNSKQPFSYENRELALKITNSVHSYLSQLYDHIPFEHNQVEQLYQQLLDKKQQQLNKIAEHIQTIIKELPNWKSKIVVQPKADENWLEPSPDADILVNNAIFTYYGDTAMVDILSDGDDDYFSLIQELRNPQKSNKILTLYTATPISDRSFYEKATEDLARGIVATVPPRISLTSNLIEQETKDVWKVKIESKYLVKTNQQYQIIGADPVPVKWIDLYYSGESHDSIK